MLVCTLKCIPGAICRSSLTTYIFINFVISEYISDYIYIFIFACRGHSLGIIIKNTIGDHAGAHIQYDSI